MVTTPKLSKEPILKVRNGKKTKTMSITVIAWAHYHPTLAPRVGATTK